MGEERREALLDEYEKSGLSAKKFALLVGMKHQTFATWATMRRKQRGVMGPRAHRFSGRWRRCRNPGAPAGLTPISARST